MGGLPLVPLLVNFVDCYKIIVERIFPQSGRTLEEIYIDYMADKIVGQITQMKMKPMPLNENKKIAV